MGKYCYDLIFYVDGIPNYNEWVSDNEDMLADGTVRMLSNSESLRIRYCTKQPDAHAYEKLEDFMREELNTQYVFINTLTVSPEKHTYTFQRRGAYATDDVANLPSEFMYKPEIVTLNDIKLSITGPDDYVVTLVTVEAEEVEARMLATLDEYFKEKHLMYTRGIHRQTTVRKSGGLLDIAKEVLAQAPTIYRENEDIIKSALEWAVLNLRK